MAEQKGRIMGEKEARGECVTREED